MSGPISTRDERDECVNCAIKTRHISWAGDPYVIRNSRTGKWHIEAESGYGKTECGQDSRASHWEWLV